MKHSKKIIILVAVLFSIVIVSGICSLAYLTRSAAKLEKEISQVLTMVNTKQWDKAKTTLEDFEKKWNHTKFGWSILIDHFEIDNIENTFDKAKKYVETEDFSSSAAELEALIHYIKHIPQKEAFSVENIL